MGEYGVYQVGQRVVYGIHGVCDIIEIEIKIIDRKKIPYFVLEPVEQPGAKFYVPSENPAALAKLSYLLTKPELEQLLKELDVSKKAWIADENRRKLYYRELISSGDRKAILQMLCALYIHKTEQEEKGKKFHLCDENFLRDAEKLLCSEVSLVLDLSYPEALAFLRSNLKTE